MPIRYCLNGHSSPVLFGETENTLKYCALCGSKTILRCSNCNTLIPESRQRPNYCISCGSPFPWTQTALETAKAIIYEDELLNSDQMAQFCQCLPDLLVETQKSNLALIRFKKFIDKATTITGNAIYDVFKDIASEAIKKKLFGD